MWKYKFIYVDDEKNNAEKLQLIAKEYDVKIDWVPYAHKLFEEYKSKIYDGIIIDAIGWVTKEDYEERKEPIPYCLAYCMQQIKSMQNEGVFINKAVFTAYEELSRNVLRDELNGILFKKEKPDAKKRMIEQLIKKAKKSDIYTIRVNYPEVFNVIEKEYYKDSTREKYIKHLSDLVKNETLDTAAIESAAGNIRNILEYYYNHSQKILNNDFYNDIEKLSEKINFLGGSPYNKDGCNVRYESYKYGRYPNFKYYKYEDDYNVQPVYILSIAQYLNFVANPVGSHDNSENVIIQKPVGMDLFKSMMHALNEFTIWFGKFVEYISDKNKETDYVSS